MRKWRPRRATRPVLWGALAVACIIAIIFIAAFAIFPLGLLVGLQHPQTSYFAFTSDVTGLGPLPTGSGNVTGLFAITSDNPVGVAVENPVNLSLTVEFPFNTTDFALKEVLFIPQLGIPTSSRYLTYLLQAPAPYNFFLRPLQVGHGYLWSGAVEITFFATGLIGGSLVFVSTEKMSNQTYNVSQFASVPPSIQVQPETATEQYATDEIVISLDLVVIALITFDLYSEYRKQNRAKDADSRSLIKEVNRGDYD